VFALENGRIVIDANGNSGGTPMNDELTRVSNSLDSINTAYYKAYEEFKGSAEEWASEYENIWVPKFKQQVLDSYQLHMNDVVGYVLTQFMSVLSVDEQLELMNNFGSWLASTQRVSKTKSTLETQQKTAVGKPFTDFQGTDVNGNTVSLSDYVGKGNYVLVDMWASWCGPCKREIPNLAKLHNLYKNKGLTVLGVYVWDEIENLAPAMEAEKITWPQIIDSNEIATKLYGVQGIPCIMLIGPDGTILDRTNLRGDNMQPTVEKFMFGK
jgi:thiol-disulfide isomerase/thioredoxin